MVKGLPLALSTLMLLAGAPSVAASTITITGTPIALPLGTAIGANNVVNNTSNLPTGYAGLTAASGSGWFQGGSVSANISSYDVDWYFIGSESGDIIRLRSLAPVFTHKEFDQNNNRGGAHFNSLSPIATTHNTTSLIPLTLKDITRGFVASNGGLHSSSIVFAYVNLNPAGNGWTVADKPTDWFAFGFNDNGSRDRDFDDYMGIAHVREVPGAQAVPGPVLGAGLPGLLLVCMAVILFSIRQRRRAISSRIGLMSA